MNNTIQLFHPEETFTYHVDKSLCKVVFLNKKMCLMLEVESTEDLDHVEEDSLQNEYPKIILNIDDFPVDATSCEELIGKTVKIPDSIGISDEDEDGETHEVFYTNMSSNEDDFELNENTLQFSNNAEGVLSVEWTGKVTDFTDQDLDSIPFKVTCDFIEKEIEVETEY